MTAQESDKPLGLRNYEKFAAQYAESVDSNPYNAYYERPAMVGLLPDVTRKRVLDAGCGSGWYSEQLVSRGATVVAVDITPKMVEIAQTRLGGSVEVHQADLAKPLDFLSDGSFDLILASLVFHYIEDWGGLFSEMSRLLQDSGHLIFSSYHPFDIPKARRARYFATELVNLDFRGFEAPPSDVEVYVRPLTGMVDPLYGAGFLVEKMVEPQPTPQCEKDYPDDYQRMCTFPRFVCIRAVKQHSVDSNGL